MKRRAARIINFLRLNFGGLVVGTAFYCFALTPSLLPRPPLFAGFIAGLSFAVGYALGVVISWIVRRFVKKELPVRIKHVAWWILLGLMVIFMLSYSMWNASWENEVRRLIGEEILKGRHVLVIFSVATVVAAVVIFISRLIAKAIMFVSRFASRWVPHSVSLVIGVIVVSAVLSLLYNGVLERTFVQTSRNIYSAQNKTTPTGISMPESPLRSGGPESLVAWDTLGKQGRAFTGGGPTTRKLQAFSGQQPADPIRVYVGLDSASDAKARAALAVRELERTGAFNRPVLVVATATGTGWVNPQAADSLEYMWNGNSAIVSMQYSYLPSWISFLVDRQGAAEAGTTLFDAVYAKWRTLPENSRPKLVVFGLSLGSYGAQAAFNDVDDLANRTDGALFLGTPSFSQPWADIVANRDKGSPQWQPIYQQGRAVAFAATNDDLASIHAEQSPHILYMQHASDPVVWWNRDLLWQKPDWLKEARGPDVSSNMQWYPFVTFAQVTVDQFFGVTVPDGHGHNYGNTIVAAWSTIAAPPEWNASQGQKLQTIINTYTAR